MTDILERHEQATPEPAMPVRRHLLALAAVEGRRLVMHPLTAVGGALSVFLLIQATWGQAPVLQRDAIITGVALLPLAATTLLAVNLAALRSRRDSTTELYGSVVATPTVRTAALLLAVAWPVALGLALVAADVGYLLVLGAVGSPAAAELLTGPVIVALGGIAGILAARVAPSLVVGPIAVVVMGAVQLVTGGIYYAGRLAGWDWLTWWHALDTAAPELSRRPSTWHLVYLLGVAALLATGCLASRSTRSKAVVAALVSVAVAGAGVFGQMRAVRQPVSRQAIAFAAAAPSTQTCRQVDGIEYCAYRDYARWISAWDAAVRPVVERLGVQPDTPLRVQQVVSAHPSDFDDQRLAREVAAAVEQTLDRAAVRPGVAWARQPEGGKAQLVLALEAAAWGVGLPTTETGRHRSSCEPSQQARAVVALWLAGQVSPEAEASLREMLEDDLYDIIVADGGATVSMAPQLSEVSGPRARYTANVLAVEWPDREAGYALQLLDRPVDDVTAALHRNWNTWIDPGTPTRRLVAALDLQPLPNQRDALVAAGVGPDAAANFVAGQGRRCSE